MIKFNKHFVTNKKTGAKCRVHYSLDNHISGKPCVTLYAKTCLDKLTPVFADTENNMDTMADYFESDRVRMFEDHPHYKAARDFLTKA